MAYDKFNTNAIKMLREEACIHDVVMTIENNILDDGIIIWTECFPKNLKLKKFIRNDQLDKMDGSDVYYTMANEFNVMIQAIEKHDKENLSKYYSYKYEEEISLVKGIGNFGIF